MATWEIIILMIVAATCVSGAIGFVYASIVNTVERYQIRKAKRELEMFAKIVEKIPQLFTMIATEMEKIDNKL